MNQKIAFFDIDGTLINVPSGLLTLHQSTIDALKTFQEKGNLIFIASARGSLPETIKGIDFDGFIGNDGHYITYKDEVWLDDLFTIQDVKH